MPIKDPWSLEEIEATVDDYLEMLKQELRGQSYNKAEHNRQLQTLLNRRNRGAVENKHQNISAILQELGKRWIEGYKPLGNYQALLREVIVRRSDEFPSL